MTAQELEKRIADNQAKLEKREKLRAKRLAKLDNLQYKLDEIKAIKPKQTFNSDELDLLYSVEELEEQVKSDVDKIKDFKRKIEKYQDQLTATVKKANSRSIKAILDFLETWKKEAYEYYYNMVPEYIKAQKQFYQEKHDYKERDEFRKTWAWLDEYLYTSTIIDDDRLQRMLTREAEAKYDDLVNRIFGVVGEIKDVSNLYVANNGQLNGYVIGESGKALVETIGAGGYNIQRFHYRTLVKKCV